MEIKGKQRLIIREQTTNSAFESRGQSVKKISGHWAQSIHR